MPNEIELKLELMREAAAKLIGSDLLAGDPAVFQQRSVYFDTPECRLSAAGFSLRIRQVGDRRIQTAKAIGFSAAGLFARPEWERDVDVDRPLLDDSTPIPMLLGIKVRDLAPVFAVEIERRCWNIITDEAAIELVLDRGEVVAGERRTSICEIELELKRGSGSSPRRIETQTSTN
ncbi:CYTH domain-containing protein [Aminobacter aganoensis]|uniref:Inorganic triphosphatase YgiF n=1 Tax=Aminobacter aganoensis TaxID=83264 RepID=A0A7X0KM68_9HYPH|nr:CYTH domain-containing protein [Aminobacter aganoensis]MBB6355812.1 inorganic triphosphatase YgiF [Aminobacter aganoensis]